MPEKIYKKLLSEYGEQGWWPINRKYNLEFKNRKKTEKEKFEIAVGAILTQSTAWKNVEKALDNLRKHKALSRKAIKEIPAEKLAQLIKPAGYYNQKARKLKEFVKFNKKITRENLLSIWGVGSETADSILLYAYDKPIFVIDAYTKRIFTRLKKINSKKYEELQKFFYKKLHADYKMFNEYHALLVEHAKQKCKIKPECENCCLKKTCRN